MCFTYAGDPLFRTMFPDKEIAKKYGSSPVPETSVARTPGTCGFCLRARYAVVSSSFIVECFGALRSGKGYHSLKHLRRYLTNGR